MLGSPLSEGDRQKQVLASCHKHRPISSAIPWPDPLRTGMQVMHDSPIEPAGMPTCPIDDKLSITGPTFEIRVLPFQMLAEYGSSCSLLGSSVARLVTHSHCCGHS